MTRDLCPTILVRPSTDADVEPMLAIYRHHITHGVGTLEGWEPAKFDADDLKQRRKSMRKHRLPHLVAEIEGDQVGSDRGGVDGGSGDGGGVAGYAYVVPFRKRPAYRYTVKHSIYVHPAKLGLGVGRALLPALIEACAGAGYRQLIGYIDCSNTTSLKLHEACGFRIVGRLPDVAWRFDRWAETVMVQRALGEGGAGAPGPWGAKGPVGA